MNKRRWAIVGIAATLAALAAVAFILIERPRAAPDCDTVRAMLDYNKSHNSRMAEDTSSTPEQEAGIDQYQEWASQIQHYSEKIADPELATHAQRFADLAKQTVILVKAARDETQHSSDRGTPKWVQDYAVIESQTRTELGSLSTRCPS
jgi:lipopolysaccharide export system protein LptC